MDYNEIFASIVKQTSIRVLLSLVAEKDLELEQMDVRTAFLHGNLEDVIYMEHGKENQVCLLLQRSLYDPKQSPRQWNKRFDSFVVKIGFKQKPI